MGEKERLALRKRKEKFRKTRFAEPSSQMESKLIPFTLLSGDRRKCEGSGTWAAGGTQQRQILVRLHPDL